MDINLFTGKKGLEISGPSGIFRSGSVMPIYSVAREIDDFSFPRATEWGGRTLTQGKSFVFHQDKAPGTQFVGDTTDLSNIKSSTYDFVMASHVFEHIANPLKAAKEWLRVLSPSGILLLIVPHKDGTFDRKRPLTTLAHLCDDLGKNTSEDDQTHFEEVLNLSDKGFSPEWFAANVRHRGLHHHVFDTRLMIQIFDYLELGILDVSPLLPFHIVVLGKKMESGCLANNESFFRTDASFMTASPFPTDRGLAGSDFVPVR